MSKVLYIGSGNSAKQALDDKYLDYIKVAANNAWRLFDNNTFDVWIHSGDFPRQNFPKDRNFTLEIYNTQYSKSADKAAKALGWDTKSPQHYAGYTIFFLGLYYIMMEIEPSEIGLLGFDHDYNPKKVEKWNDGNRPNIQNQFHNKKESTIKEWADNYFADMEEDFFYGHGTPDPMRLGVDELQRKMEIAKDSSESLGIEIFNYSGIDTGINTFKQKII